MQFEFWVQGSHRSARWPRPGNAVRTFIGSKFNKQTGCLAAKTIFRRKLKNIQRIFYDSNRLYHFATIGIRQGQFVIIRSEVCNF